MKFYAYTTAKQLKLVRCFDINITPFRLKLQIIFNNNTNIVHIIDNIDDISKYIKSKSYCLQHYPEHFI